MKSFLEDRKAQVRINNATSEWIKLQEGLPQGAVSSPVLFLIYMNEWQEFKEEGVEYSGFADDVAMWITSQDKQRLAAKAEKALEKLEKWSRKNKIELNPSKTEACLYTQDASEKMWDPHLRLDAKKIEMKKEIKLLGVTIEQNMCFHKQTEKVVNKIKKRTQVLRALAGRDWELREKGFGKNIQSGSGISNMVWHSTKKMPLCLYDEHSYL